MLSQFATWNLRPELVKRARGEAVSEGQVNGATQRIRVAGALLTWLRARGRELAACTQADIEAWFASPPSTRVHAVPFLRWALATRRAPSSS